MACISNLISWYSRAIRHKARLVPRHLLESSSWDGKHCPLKIQTNKSDACSKGGYDLLAYTSCPCTSRVVVCRVARAAVQVGRAKLHQQNSRSTWGTCCAPFGGALGTCAQKIWCLVVLDQPGRCSGVDTCEPMSTANKNTQICKVVSELAYGVVHFYQLLVSTCRRCWPLLHTPCAIGEVIVPCGGWSGLT
jgi:hypothetical protein